MAEKFDPYYTWLGIPPQEQPPHFYRLLGLEAFEENREVIATAANRQLEYLRDLGEGEQRKYAEKLLEFISKARVCLLDPQRKATYDDRLRTKQAQDNLDNLAPLSDKDPGSRALSDDLLDEAVTGLATPRTRRPPATSQRPPTPITAGTAEEQSEDKQSKRNFNKLLVQIAIVLILAPIAFFVAMSFRPEKLPEVAGYVYEDLDNNGVPSRGEGIADRVVFVDLNDDGKFNVAEENFSALTNTQGYFNIKIEPDKLLPDNYTLVHEFRVEDRYAPTNESQEIDLTDVGLSELAQQPHKFDFGVKRLVKIIGTIFEDWNNDKKINAGELGLPERIVYIDINSDEAFDAEDPNTTTDKRGRFTIRLPATSGGKKRVRSVLTDYNYSPPSTGLTHTSSADIPVRKKHITLEGIVFEDLNGDGAHSTDEQGIEGRLVFIDLDDNGVFDKEQEEGISTTTDNEGRYEITVPNKTEPYTLHLDFSAEEELYQPSPKSSQQINLLAATVLPQPFGIQKKPIEEKTPSDGEQTSDGGQEGEDESTFAVNPRIDPEGYLISLGLETVGEDNVWQLAIDLEAASELKKQYKLYQSRKEEVLPEVHLRKDKIVEAAISIEERSRITGNKKLTQSLRDAARKKIQDTENSINQWNKEMDTMLEPVNQVRDLVNGFAQTLTIEKNNYDKIMAEDSDARKKFGVALELLDGTLDDSIAPKRFQAWELAEKHVAEIQLEELGLEKLENKWLAAEAVAFSRYQKKATELLQQFGLQVQQDPHTLKRIQSSTIKLKKLLDEDIDFEDESAVKILNSRVRQLEANINSYKQRAPWKSTERQYLKTVDRALALINKIIQKQEELNPRFDPEALEHDEQLQKYLDHSEAKWSPVDKEELEKQRVELEQKKAVVNKLYEQQPKQPPPQQPPRRR